MICIKAEIPKELNDTVCIYIFKSRDLRNEFVEKTKGMNKSEREEIYKNYE